MPLILDLERINSWRSAQRNRITRYANAKPEPNISPARSAGFRVGRLAAGVFFFFLPASFVYILAALLPSLGDGAPRIVAMLAVAGITGGLWKAAWSLVREAVGRTAPDDALRTKARDLAKQGQALEAAGCFAMSLTHPWRKRAIPSFVKVNEFHKKYGPKNGADPVFIALADLLFVDLWLEVTLNTGAFSGLGLGSEHLLPKFVTDSDALVEFCILLRKMDPGAQPDPYLAKLAKAISVKGPRAAVELLKAQ